MYLSRKQPDLVTSRLISSEMWLLARLRGEPLTSVDLDDLTSDELVTTSHKLRKTTATYPRPLNMRSNMRKCRS